MVAGCAQKGLLGDYGLQEPMHRHTSALVWFPSASEVRNVTYLLVPAPTDRPTDRTHGTHAVSGLCVDGGAGDLRGGDTTGRNPHHCEWGGPLGFVPS